MSTGSSSSVRVDALLGVLVRRLVPSAVTEEGVFEKNLGVCASLWRSSLRPEIADDVFAVAEHIKRKLVRAKRLEDAARFSSVFRRFSVHPAVSNKWAVLYLLYSLFGSVGGGAAGASGAGNAPPVLSSLGALLPNVDSVAAVAARRSAAQAAGGAAGGVAAPAAATPSGLPGALVDDGEAELVRDLMYVLAGSNGRLLVSSGAADGSYRAEPGVRAGRSAVELALRMSECGAFVSRIERFIEHGMQSGLVLQSFCAALRAELTEFRRLVAAMDGQRSQLTLRRMAMWLTEPQRRLRTLAALCEQARGKRGGELAGVLHKYTRHGGLQHDTVSSVMQKVCMSIMSMMRAWVCEGELEDAFGEFFVSAQPDVEPEMMWSSGYRIRQNMLPSFVPPWLAESVLRTGKSINFIRRLCNDPEWVLHSAATATNWSEVAYDDAERIGQLVGEAAHETNKRVLELLFGSYKLKGHLAALKRYLLLGQGDFVQVVMDRAGEELTKRADAILPHHLSALLEGAVRASNAQYDDADFVNRLDARKLKAAPGDIGWDVFSLDYRVDAPLSSVLHPEVMQSYLRISNFLWRLRRIQYTLTATWQRQVAHRSLHKLVAMRQALQRCYVLRTEMLHFINGLQYYIMFEVLESNWHELCSQLDTVKDLDGVLAAHDSYIAKVAERTMLTADAAPMLIALRRIFDAVLKFRGVQDRLVGAAVDALARRDERARRQQQQSLEGKWGVSGEDARGGAASSSDPDAEDDLEAAAGAEALQRATEVRQSYRDALGAFRSAAGSHPDPSFRFVVFRLDFNDFYAADTKA